MGCNALIVVDVQNDFMPAIMGAYGGALAVPEANAIIDPLNEYMRNFDGFIVATQDWHPPNHSSFKEHGGEWPRHCVGGTYGARFWEQLHTNHFHAIIRKGYNQKHDSYSGFFDADRNPTGLLGMLTSHVGTRNTIFVVGLAKDFCVKATAEDALLLCPDVRVIDSLTKPVFPEKNNEINEFYKSRGIKLV